MSDRTKSVQQFCLKPGFQDEKVHMDLFTVLELFPEAFKHLRIHLLWGAGHSFYVELEDALQEVIHFCVVIIIVPDAKHAVDIVPNPTLEGGMIAALPLGHGTALETIDLPELVI